LPLFWVSFSGLPRRLHDFPAIYMGWQSMATAGHFITMLGVLAFYLMLLDSKLEKKVTVVLTALISRLNKRILYYISKLIWISLETKKVRAYIVYGRCSLYCFSKHCNRSKRNDSHFY
jgi:heme/copper-type cytochrome/quinol oxidase subunit 1